MINQHNNFCIFFVNCIRLVIYSETFPVWAEPVPNGKLSYRWLYARRIRYATAPVRRMHWAMMLSDVCLTSVAYIGPKSRTERPRETKIGTEVAHVTHDSDTTFKVKRSKINLLLMS